jgi:hypothetical protein
MGTRGGPRQRIVEPGTDLRLVRAELIEDGDQVVQRTEPDPEPHRGDAVSERQR